MGNTVAISDVGIKLYTAEPSATTGFEHLISVTSIPAFGAEPALIEVTELDSEVTQNIMGRKNLPSLNFGFNYTEAKYAKLYAIDGLEKAFLTVYQDGSGVKVIGTSTAYTNAQSRNSATEGTLTVIATSMSWLTKSEVDALIA